jgi:quinol monooxygenase YgiN
MIGAIATIKIQADKCAEFEGHFTKLAAQVRAHEPGCLLYRLAKSRDEPATYKVMELYADQAAVDHHMGTAYFQAAGQNLAPLVSAAPVIEVLDVIDEG